MATGVGSGNTRAKLSEKRKTEIHETLHPDGRELSIAEWLEAAQTIPEIKNISIQKMVGGAWSKQKDLDTIGPGFNVEGVEKYIHSTWKDGRYKLQGRSEMGTVIGNSPPLFLGDWETAEANPSTNVERATAAVVPPSSVSRLAGKLEERIETATVIQAVEKLDDMERRQQVSREFGPVQSVMDMMKTFAEMTKRDEGLGTKEIFAMMMQMQQSQMTLMVEMMKAREGGTNNLSALSEIVKILDTVRDTFGFKLTRGDDDDGGGGLMNVLKGAAPFIRDTLQGLQARPAVPALPAATPPTTSAPTTPTTSTPPVEATMGATQHPAVKRIIDIVVNALKSEGYPTVQAALVNLRDGMGQPLVMIDPKADPNVYAALLSIYDERFGEMAPQIGGYLKWLRDMDEREERDAADTAGAP